MKKNVNVYHNFIGGLPHWNRFTVDQSMRAVKSEGEISLEMKKSEHLCFLTHQVRSERGFSSFPGFFSFLQLKSMVTKTIWLPTIFQISLCCAKQRNVTDFLNIPHGTHWSSHCSWFQVLQSCGDIWPKHSHKLIHKNQQIHISLYFKLSTT